ncbi:alpha/beta fold hydrolase [Rhodococcus sp. T7]|uniref:alpha/beta fold hydrolase n=1 Tax=Rhodococcus sp. T7 TaxID=627444 RepID=UPI00135936FD|nr:alpha/beta hydrolase [Rhodococcus sp. T7]KAF0957624.1 2-succinyl-6-hydroxy-2,4-cyclohexadiene-1-carboxylate synthase [Rhodococcus sp. T7]KAF0963304.1 2-succinyl-6-hydroxy-2,4-cyclohexadiene-1-carboxylate synthase [Rhodococcus sp. T7]
MPWIELAGNDIHYTDTGTGDPVVLVHGHGSAAACWEPIIAALAPRFRVLAYDSYDHGYSANSRREGPMADRATELEEFIGKLGLARPVVFGQSMGGMTTLRWALRHPAEARALVVCGMGWPLLPMDDKIASALDDEERIWLGVGESFTPDWIEANPVEHARYIRVRSTAAAIEAARHRRPMTSSQDEFLSEDPAAADRTAAGLKAISSPLLLFAGSKEAPFIMHGVENTHSLVPNSTLVIADGAAHNAYYQERELLLASFENLLATNLTTA